MSADALPDQGVWTREQIEHVWDVFAQAGYAHDRESMYYDEGADSEFCETHRRSLRVALDLAKVVPLDDSFDGLMRVAQTILDRHYPAELFNAENPIVGDDPGTHLVVALRRCIEARSGASDERHDDGR
jgi:hypothetical protein